MAKTILELQQEAPDFQNPFQSPFEGLPGQVPLEESAQTEPATSFDREGIGLPTGLIEDTLKTDEPATSFDRGIFEPPVGLVETTLKEGERPPAVEPPVELPPAQRLAEDVVPEPISEITAPIVPKEQKLDEDVIKKEVKPFVPPATDVDKTIETKLDNIDLASLDFIEQMIAGDDPIAELAFNWQIQKLGPIFQAQSADLILSLKQQGIFGTNAGSAWLANMAQRQGVQVADIVNRINYESAVRIEDWNRYGPERANAIAQNRLTRRIDKYDFGMQQINDLVILGSTNPQDYLNIAAANGVQMSQQTADFVAKNVASQNEADVSAAIRELNTNYSLIEADLEAMVPGLVISGSALGSLTADQQADLRSRVKEINNAIKINDVEKAQELIQELKELYPNAVVGDYSEWNPADFRTLADQAAKKKWRLEAKDLWNSGDQLGAIDIILDKIIDPLTIGANFDALWATTSPERKAELIAQSGLDGEPITDDDKGLILAYDIASGMNKTTVEEIYKSYFDNAEGVSIAGIPLKEWLLNPENADLTRSWIFQVISGPYEIDENGLIVPVAGQQLPPWNPDANNSHFFTDWAMADSYDEANDELNITYSGGNGYENDNEFQTSTEYAPYRDQMDDAWESYKKGGGELDRQSWFDDVKPVWNGDNVIFNGEAAETFGGGEFDPTTAALTFLQESIQAYDAAIKAGDISTLSDAQLFAVFAPGTGDPEAVDKLIEIGTRQEDNTSITTVDLNGVKKKIFNTETWLATGLEADNVAIDGDPGTTGAGVGNGTIIIFNGRPMRITFFGSDKTERDTLFETQDTRAGTIKGVYLDEENPEEITIMDSGEIDL